MKHIFSSPTPRGGSRIARMAVLLVIVTFSLATATYTPVAAHAATSANIAPTPPLGFVNPVANQDLTQLAGKDPNIHVKTITLPATTCAQLQKAQHGASCQALDYWSSTTNLPLPQGTRNATASAAGAAYWYWSGWDELCSIYTCHTWSMKLTMDGVANGTRVWQWNEGCSANGNVYSANTTWCGYLYNGGGWPHYAMQFGLNGKVCTISIGPIQTLCFDHGIRRWVNDSGNFTSLYTW